MPKLGLGLSSPQTNSFSLPPSSRYTGTNVLSEPRLDARVNTTPIVISPNGGFAVISGEDPFIGVGPFRHYSPTFLNVTSTYDTLAPAYLPYAFPPYPVDNSGPAGRHLFKLFGIGSTLIPFNNFNRVYPDPPMRQITSDTTGSGGITQDWAKYEMYQVVNIPVGATVVNFGAMVLCPASDDLRPYNFGGFYIFAGSSSTNKWSVDFAAICGSSVPILPGSLGAPFYTNYQESVSNSLYMWAGPSFAPGGEAVNRWNSSLYLRGQDVLDGGSNTAQRPASDYRTWKQLNIRIPLPLGGSGNGVDNTKLGFSMYFAESRGYLNNSGTQSGSIWIYDPYVVFS